MTNMVDAVGTTKYTYANGLLASEDGPWSSDTVSLSYQNARERSQLVLIQPTGNAWTNSYGWDADHRLSTLTSPAGTHTYTYNSQGSLVRKLALPGGRYITNTFDSSARVIDTSVMTNSSGTFFNRHGYAYNNAHQRTTISRTNSSATGWNGYSTITYDDAGQVRTVSGFDASGVSVPADNFAYGYDAGWNMLKRTNNVTVSTYTPNVLNQAAGIYDNNGNRTSGTDSYTYDAENQLVRVEQASSWKLEYTYDGQQRLRIVKDYQYSGGSYTLRSETRYVYDGMLLLQERNSSGHPTVTYSRGRDLSGSFEGAGGIGGLLARTAHATSSPFQPSTHAYYHADGNGNVTYLTRGDGSSVGGYKFDPFGRLVASTGTLASGNLMRFSSKLWSQSSSGSTGLYYYGYRFYDPTSQRWMNRDPMGDAGALSNGPRSTSVRSRAWESLEGPNLYGFVRNRPIGAVDTDGRLCLILPEEANPVEGLPCALSIKDEVWNQYGWDNTTKQPHPGHVPGDKHFHYGHCVAHCRITRECPGGALTSWIGGLAKEIIEEFKEWGGSGGGFEGGDLDANREGRSRAKKCPPSMSCEEACRGMEG